MYLTKIKNIYPDLTGSEMKIADYILANKGNIGEMTSNELADCLGVGQSTIIRFSQKLGYKTFKKFLFDVINDSDEKEDNEVQLSDSTAVTVSKIRDRYKELLDIVHDLNTDHDFERIIKLLGNSRQVITYGFLATGSIASYLSDSLVEMNINSFYSSAIVQIKQQILFADKNTILFLISKTGESHEVVELAKYAKEQGVKVIAITAHTKNTLASLADDGLKIMTTNMRTRLHTYSSSVELIYIIDCMILLLYKKDYAKYRKNVEKYIEIVRPNQSNDDSSL